MLASPRVSRAHLPLLFNHGLEDLPRRYVVVPRQRDPDEPLVVPQVQVDLPAVVQNENLAVLEGRHGSRIDVQIRVDLDARAPGGRVRQEEEKRGGGGHRHGERRVRTALSERDGMGATTVVVVVVAVAHLSPRDLRRTPIDEAVTPFPRPETTPPVT